MQPDRIGPLIVVYPRQARERHFDTLARSHPLSGSFLANYSGHMPLGSTAAHIMRAVGVGHPPGRLLTGSVRMIKHRLMGATNTCHTAVAFTLT